jgi:Na+-translocating ferredoxin:NAD+ oxidoreductase RNF subunit RnfB
MLESTDVICTLHKDGEINSIVRYQFSMVEKTSSEWIFKTLEVSDNMEYPGDSMHQKNNVIVLEEENIPMNSKELIYLDSNARMGFPELFTRIYKAFDTKDEALFEECCNDYNQIIIRNAKLEKENAKLNFELMKLRYRDNEQNTFLENLYERLATQLEKNKI